MFGVFAAMAALTADIARFRPSFPTGRVFA
jgi:hypothetical protein